jgi:outer membrane beta-barrel protein
MISLLLSASLGLAADSGPVDLGAIKPSEVKVVQKMMYTKAGRSEMGAHLGAIPFDGFTLGLQGAGTYARHTSDSFGWEVQVGAGWGFKTPHYDLLESPTYGVAVEAYHYLASAQATVEYAPVYAKMKVGNRVIHHDLYVLGGAGGTLERSVLEGHDLTASPTLPLGVGARVWLAKDRALRVELRDNLMLQHRVQSDTWGFKQNAIVSVGVTSFDKAKK